MPVLPIPATTMTPVSPPTTISPAIYNLIDLETLLDLGKVADINGVDINLRKLRNYGCTDFTPTNPFNKNNGMPIDDLGKAINRKTKNS